MYVQQGQEHQYDIFRNQTGSRHYQAFASGLGWLVSSILITLMHTNTNEYACILITLMHTNTNEYACIRTRTRTHAQQCQEHQCEIFKKNI